VDVRRSMRRGPIDAVMLMLGKSPFRCRACGNRFYQSEDRTEEMEEDDLEEGEAADSA
jgi:hypothetical protein